MNEKNLSSIIDRIEDLPFLKSLEAKVVAWEIGKCQLFVPDACQFLDNISEIKLSGLCAIISEACAYIAVCTQLDTKETPVIYNTQMKMISSFSRGGISVYSDVAGTADSHLIESRIIDEHGTLIALSTNCYCISADTAAQLDENMLIM